jgi:hypothetical protein
MLPVRQVWNELEEDYKEDALSDFPDFEFTPNAKGYAFRISGTTLCLGCRSSHTHTHTHTQAHTHRHTGTQTHRHRQKDTQTHRHTDTHTHIHTHTHTQPLAAGTKLDLNAAS